MSKNQRKKQRKQQKAQQPNEEPSSNDKESEGNNADQQENESLEQQQQRDREQIVEDRVVDDPVEPEEQKDQVPLGHAQYETPKQAEEQIQEKVTESNRSEFNKESSERKEAKDNEQNQSANEEMKQDVQEKEQPSNHLETTKEAQTESEKISEEQVQTHVITQKQSTPEEQSKIEKSSDNKENQSIQQENSQQQVNQSTSSNQSNLGTKNQTDVINDYPTQTREDKLLIPYIEKQNGALLLADQDYENAIVHFNKSIVAMKMLFESSLIDKPELAVKYIKEIEISVNLSLALCYIKTQKYHYAIKFCTTVLEKDDENVLALYRRGTAYMNISELNKASQDLLKVNEITKGQNQNVLSALRQLQQKQEQNQLKQQKQQESGNASTNNSESRKNSQSINPQENFFRKQVPYTQKEDKQGHNSELLSQASSAEQGHTHSPRQDAKQDTKKLDTLFELVMNIIKILLLIPLNLYLIFMAKIVKYFCKALFVVISIGQMLPYIGPKVTILVDYISQLSMIKWLAKFKEE